jgi:competence protein ComEC
MHHARGACRRLAGILIASHLNFEWIEWLALSGMALSGLALLRRRKVARWLFGCLMTATLSATRWELAAAQSLNNDLEPYNGTRQRLIDHGGGSVILRLTESLRRRAQVVLRSALPAPESALLEGILLGDENSIPDDLRRDFNATGTTHIIAISGFNITIIATLAIAGFGGWLGARRGMLAAALAIAGYTLLVGANPSVVRAAFMAGFGLAARRSGRQSHAVASLAGTAGIMTAINPQALWDIGFQHSFAATLGLILYAAPLQHLFERLTAPVLGSERAHRFAGPAGEYLLFTLAAQVMTLPLTLFYFQRFSLTALVANPLILPLQPAVMILGGLATTGGLIWSPMGRILGTSPGRQLP